MIMRHQETDHPIFHDVLQESLLAFSGGHFAKYTVGAKSTSPVPNFANKSRKVYLPEKYSVICYLNMRIEICRRLLHEAY